MKEAAVKICNLVQSGVFGVVFSINLMFMAPIIFPLFLFVSSAIKGLYLLQVTPLEHTFPQ